MSGYWNIGILWPAVCTAAGLLAFRPMFAGAADTPRPSGPKPVLLLRHATNSRIVPPLIGQDFDVRVSQGPLTAESLAQVRVLCLMQPVRAAAASGPILESISAAEIDGLIHFIDAGGGVLFCTRPTAREDAPARPEDKFLQRFGVSASPVRIGPKMQQLPDAAPLLGGLRWSATDLHVLDLSESGPLTSPVLVMNDLQQKPAKPGAKDFPGTIMIWGGHGKGRVVFVADSAWPAASELNEARPAPRDKHDNARIFHRLVRWLGSE